MNMVDKKDYRISIIRMISMLMIVACHILQGLNNKWAFWVNVGVQVFFFISGFLYGQKKIKDTKSFYIRRWKKVCIPYYIIFLLMLLLERIILKKYYPFHQILGCFLGFGAFTGSIVTLSHTWFVTYVMLCYLLVPVLQNIFKSQKFKTNFIRFLLLTALVHAFQIYGLINIETSWINNFIIGYFYSKCYKDSKQEKKLEIFILTMFFLIIPFSIIYQENLPIALPNLLNSRANSIINYGHVLLGSLLFISLYEILSMLKLKENRILTFSDKYSYEIYLVHQIFILNSFSVLFLTKSLAINIILILLLSVLSAIILKKVSDFFIALIERIFSKLTGTMI